jgi:hypothetical protein
MVGSVSGLGGLGVLPVAIPYIFFVFEDSDNPSFPSEPIIMAYVGAEFVVFGEGDSDGSTGWIGKDRPSGGCYHSSSGWMRRRWWSDSLTRSGGGTGLGKWQC